ncbi:hypothetical protein HN018_24195 (plasmid) [Lichenicola cladoniae]|uniref:Uncharacterized protein n=1 Tax=Lichenicola cladoniae TaxID=1484109 RepID=A0A6M8HYT7_9PROT|nr:hypothetical protein [Lichenicola cladoniae]NPD70286.1 hypothetical protein [Acetobacteraceae bacterium]QKE93315.1 hypothetical protein HN018_24195 [Lichenicola cladoniae]
MAQKLDPSRATAGRWLTIPTHMTMYDGDRLPTFAVIATGPDACEQFVGRAHPKSGTPDERPVVEMDARLFAASKAMATLLLQALAYEEDAFRLDMPVDGGDLVQWFAE